MRFATSTLTLLLQGAIALDVGPDYSHPIEGQSRKTNPTKINILNRQQISTSIFHFLSRSHSPTWNGKGVWQNLIIKYVAEAPVYPMIIDT
jgi:hypothetical protein